MAAKLADNKTLFCHFSGKALNNTSEQSEESLSSAVFEVPRRFLSGYVGTTSTTGMTVSRFGSVYIELRFFLLCNTEIQTLGKKVCCTVTIRKRTLLLQQRVYLQQQAFSSRQIFNNHCVVHVAVQRAIHIYDATEWDSNEAEFGL